MTDALEPPRLADRKTHWDEVHQGKRPDEQSWFEPRPEVALSLIRRVHLPRSARIVDVGGGASRLVDALLDHGFADVTVLDISGAALDEARARLGRRADSVTWVEADVTRATLEGPFDLWHDRAVFHFLTDGADRARYRALLEASLAPGGHAIVATFAEDGPLQCSGLPVVRYAPDILAAELGPGLALVATRREVHRTPAGRLQSFVHCLFRREPT